MAQAILRGQLANAHPGDISNGETVWSNGTVTTAATSSSHGFAAPTSSAETAESTSSMQNPVLDEFLETSVRRAEELSPAFAGLWREIARLSRGGKRLRPKLVAMAAQGFARVGPASGQEAPGEERGSSGTAVNHHAIASVGAAFEILHTALIVHDDVIDRDDQRRHGPTLHAAAERAARDGGTSSERASQYGRSVAIIAGDLALSAAHRLVATAGLGGVDTAHLLALVDDAVFASAAGELLDIDHALGIRQPGADDVLMATQLKTAVYSFEAPLKAGAVLAGASAQHVAALGMIGRDLGLAFQLADDLLGVFGEDQNTGKSTTGDLREGKYTLLIAETVRGTGSDEILGLIGADHPGDGDLERARCLIEDSGARAAVEERARQAAVRAVEHAQTAGLAPELVRDLREVARSAVERIR